MKIAVTGASGELGHWIAHHLLAHGHEVITLGRRPSRHSAARHLAFDLGQEPPDLAGCGALVHAAFAHLQGRYRGGEGDDPEGFVALNRDGTIRLFQAARGAGVRRIVFLSSRAVYGAYPPGTRLAESLAPRPDTLYGRVKLEAEEALAALAGPDLAIASLRATGVFGPSVPGLRHKWTDLLDTFARGEDVLPRAGTELHVLDLAEAVLLLVEAQTAALAPGVFNASDFILDRRDLLERWSEASGIGGRYPDRADAASLNVMDTDRLRALGWQPRGPRSLHDVLRSLARTGPIAENFGPGRGS